MQNRTTRGALIGVVTLVAATIVALSNYPHARTFVQAEVLAGADELAAAPAGAAEIESNAKATTAKSDDAEVRNTKSGKGPRGALPLFTPEREAAAMTFVEAHHQELAPLLVHLKKSRPGEYQKAIRKLFNDSERLAHNREMQPQRYELELQEWKLGSRIELLVARLSMDRNPALEAELRRTLTEQMEIRRALLNLERERLLQRAKMLDKQIIALEQDREEKLDEWFEKAVNSTGSKKK